MKVIGVPLRYQHLEDGRCINYLSEKLRLTMQKAGAYIFPIAPVQNVYYIDTYSTLNNREKYFSNSNSYYPNNIGHFEITKKIISKTLEIS